MFSFFKRNKASTNELKEYGTAIKEFYIPPYGSVKYAQWLNPAESQKTVTESQIGFFKKFVKEGDFAIDVGAHTGDTTLPLALAVGSQGQVLAMEPSTIIFKVHPTKAYFVV